MNHTSRTPAMSAKYWARLPTHIHVMELEDFIDSQWYAAWHKTADSFYRCQTVNTASFLEHMDKVQGGRQDGPDTGQGTVAHISGGREILRRARHYCPAVSYRTSIPESRRGSMGRTLTCNESFHTLCRQGCTSGSSVWISGYTGSIIILRKSGRESRPKKSWAIHKDGWPAESRHCITYQVSSEPAQKQWLHE